VDLDQIADRLAISTLTPEASIAVFLASALVAVAALSRAAQVPFGVWLPAGRLAPSAPTAAVHVLVTASGAALLIRLGLLLHPSVILAAAAIGAGSASLAVAGSLSSGPRGRERWLTILPLGSVLAVLAVPGPATPFAASVLLGAVMIMRAALILGAPRPAASAGRPAGLGLDALYDRWIVPAVRWTTGVVVRGAEEAIEAIATSAAGVVVGAGVAARALQGGPLWVHEALLVAAALVIVVYWIVR
jgi:NADH:ubiquinone oxidoreductase subunit 5 (subunit L)/multisubunit Na+/H+ antiporter MnhA subunit